MKIDMMMMMMMILFFSFQVQKLHIHACRINTRQLNIQQHTSTLKIVDFLTPFNSTDILFCRNAHNLSYPVPTPKKQIGLTWSEQQESLNCLLQKIPDLYERSRKNESAMELRNKMILLLIIRNQIRTVILY